MSSKKHLFRVFLYGPQWDLQLQLNQYSEEIEGNSDAVVGVHFQQNMIHHRSPPSNHYLYVAGRFLPILLVDLDNFPVISQMVQYIHSLSHIVTYLFSSQLTVQEQLLVMQCSYNIF